MLPEILEVAQKNKLVLDPQSKNREEVLSKCPFCHEDSKPGKKRKYYLSLNTKKQTFKCWFCGESGGVFRFISLLENIPESQLIQRARKRKIIHPAERLTRTQLVLLGERFGYFTLPNWREMKQRDRSYYLRTLDLVWEDWKQFLEIEKRDAFRELILGISLRKYSDSVERIIKREQEIGVLLINEVLMIYSCAERPKWTESIEISVQGLLKSHKS